MKNVNLYKSFILVLLCSTLSACEAVAGIFKAGMGFGIFIVIAVIALIIVMIMRMGKSKNP